MTTTNTLHPADDPEADYADPTEVVKLRIFTEPTGDSQQWSIDGVDARGQYTELCLSYDTFGQAVDAIPYFMHLVMGDSMRWCPE